MLDRVGFSVLFFFFSSRRRHTRLVSDWSSDVCSSDLDGIQTTDVNPPRAAAAVPVAIVSFAVCPGSRKCTCKSRSEERREGKSVDVGGRRMTTKEDHEDASGELRSVNRETDGGTGKQA